MSATIRKRPDGRWEADVGKVLGRRRRFVRDSKEDAQGAAAAFLRRVNDHGADLTMEQAQEASAAFGAIRESGSSLGLLAIVERFLDSVEDGSEVRPTVGEAIELRLKSMQERNLRPRSIQSTHYRLLVLSGLAGENVANVTANNLRPIIQQSSNHATQTNVITELSAFFEFCRKRGWVKENPCAHLDKPKVDRGMPKFMGPGNVELFMDAAIRHDRYMALIPALGFFAGLRPDEIMKLEWPDLGGPRFDHIRIRPEASKVRRSRIVKIEKNLLHWMDATACYAGQISALCLKFAAWRRTIKLEWPPDVMRHSFCSHHYALYQNAALTAAQMGNSNDVMFRHYRGLATKEDAEKYFAIFP